MLTEQNIEAELSYAYLHAVATRGGFACSYTDRHLDGAGVDAQVHEDGRMLAEDSLHTSFTLHVQLKATRLTPLEQIGRFSFSLPLRQYNRLRERRLVNPRLLVVLFLPEDPRGVVGPFGGSPHRQKVRVLGQPAGGAGQRQ